MGMQDRLKAPQRVDQLFWQPEQLSEAISKFFRMLLIVWLHLVSFPVEPLLRTNQGSRFARCWAGLLLVILGIPVAKFAQLFGVFLLASGVLTLVNSFRSLHREIFRPEAPWLHTRRIGVPWGGTYPGFWRILRFFRLPLWPFTVAVVYEPLLCFCAGLICCFVDPILGIYLMVAAFALSGKMIFFFFGYLENLRNVNDQVVASRGMDIRSGKSSRGSDKAEFHQACVAMPSWQLGRDDSDQPFSIAETKEADGRGLSSAEGTANLRPCPRCSALLKITDRNQDRAITCHNCQCQVRVGPRRRAKAMEKTRD